MIILLIVVLVVLFGGGGGYYYGRNAGWGTPRYYGSGLIGLLVVVLVVLWLAGTVGGGSMIR